MKRILVVLVPFLVFFIGCMKKEQAIHIAAILPLTGSAAQWGTPPQNAVQLAADEINLSGGIKGHRVIIDFQDDQCESSNGVSALQSLIVTQKPIAIIGAVCSSVSLAIAPIAEQNKITMISPASTSPLLTNAGDYIFRVIPTDALRGKIFAEYVYSLGHRRIAMLYINNEGGSGNQMTFAENFKNLGGTILSVEAYMQDARDMRAQLTKIKKVKPDALVIVSYPDDTPIVLRQAQELNVKVPLFFQTEALDDPTVLQKAGKAAEDATYILPAKPEGSAANEFVKKYKEKYGRVPELFASEGYDAMMLIAKALNSNKDMSSDAIKSFLYQTKNYAGASGIITFDNNGDVIKPMAIMKIKNNISNLIKIISE